MSYFRVHGMTKEATASAPKMDEVLKAMKLSFCGHNIAFDDRINGILSEVLWWYVSLLLVLSNFTAKYS
jgi:hypothetical protein